MPRRPLLLPFFLILAVTTRAQAPALQPQDLAPLHGSWHGELMYVDYTTSAETQIPATLLVTPLDARRWLIGFGYTEEPHANEMDTLVLSADGSTLDGFAVLEVERYSPDSVRLVLQAEGMDDERPAELRKTWTAGPHNCTLRKEVQPKAVEGAAAPAFFLRHAYRFRR